MFGSQFYHQSIRKYVIMFGNMFNDIVVRRLDPNGVSLQTVNVPLAYGPKEKFLVRITQDPNLDQQVAIQLPRMGFEMTTLAYDGVRRLGGSTRNVKVADDKNKLDFTYVPVPYDMNFSLYAYVRNADDGAQIMEQIVPSLWVLRSSIEDKNSDGVMISSIIISPFFKIRIKFFLIPITKIINNNRQNTLR